MSICAPAAGRDAAGDSGPLEPHLKLDKSLNKLSSIH
jgi:hypothetical protein